jgi:phosphoribosylformylglycinamidine synthase
MEYEKRVHDAMREIAAEGLAESAHDLSDGGLAVAAAESSFGPSGTGAELDLESGMRAEFLLFHEGPSRILISTARPERVAAIAARHGVEAPRIGITIEGRLRIRNYGQTLADQAIIELKDIWEHALEDHLRG